VAQLWGTTKKVLDGVTGEAATLSTTWTSYLNPRRLASNSLVDVRHPLGEERGGGTFEVTLSPITLAGGGPIALAAGVFETAWRKPMALVQFGKHGIKHTALVDWPFGGATFTVAADTLTVDAWALDPNPALPTEPDHWDVQLGAHAVAVPTSATKNTPPRCTMQIGTIAVGSSSGDVWLPNFARRYRLEFNNPTGIIRASTNAVPVLNVFFRRWFVSFAQDNYGGVGAAGGGIGWGSMTLAPHGPYIVPSNTQTMVVTLEAAYPAGGLVDAALAFDLDLGG
jgi:hypothetical protein